MTNLSFSFVFLLFLFFPSKIFSQNKTEFTSELFRIILSDNLLIVEDHNNKQVYSNEFNNPSVNLLDLDNDGNEELLVKDTIHKGNDIEYLLYIYNLLDTFYLAGKINSGITEPYQTFSGEVEGLLIISGNPAFSNLSKKNKKKINPINCWKFEEGEIIPINEDLYEIFITENDAILSAIEDFKTEEPNDCGRLIKSLITAAYINYLSAGDNASADNFLRTFYQCDDLDQFQNELDSIFYKEN